MSWFEKLLLLLVAAHAVALFVFVGCCMAESWGAPEYPYTGFCPDYPTHTER